MTILPFGHRGFFIQPFQVGGQTPGGVWLENDRGESLHHKSIPPIFGRVTATHPSCREVRVGDWVVYAPGRPTRVRTPLGNIYALDERLVIGIVQHPDQQPWFIEETTHA